MDDMSMSMSMSMSSSPTETMSGMSMASSTSTSDAMHMSSGSALMGMDSMAMTFFTSTSTPLYSMAWTPESAGQYAGTCIFLIVFATLFRALLALRVNFFDALAVLRKRRGEDVIYGYADDCKQHARPWRAGEAVMLSCLDVLLAGIGYLLMIAVMTMNVGYFLSVLAGVFLGSLVFARFLAHSAAH